MVFHVMGLDITYAAETKSDYGVVSLLEAKI